MVQVLVKKLLYFVGLPSTDPLKVPRLVIDKVTNVLVKYRVRGNVGMTDTLITGFEVIRFGVPMIGEYENTLRGKRVTISPAVPGAQYRITAWALGGGNRSATPAVEDVATGETSELHSLHSTTAIEWDRSSIPMH